MSRRYWSEGRVIRRRNTTRESGGKSYADTVPEIGLALTGVLEVATFVVGMANWFRYRTFEMSAIPEKIADEGYKLPVDVICNRAIPTGCDPNTKSQLSDRTI